ncbi:MAG: hypothetical protein PUC66_06125 [Erysipelotrichaceae bacterium]|nr:hypothetical protein [Erysipelotrichaceae bacterium]
MSGLTEDMLESWLDDLKYREVIIGYKGIRYHIEAYNKKYVIGVFKKNIEEIDHWIEVVGDTDDDAYNKLMNEPLFGKQALKDVIHEIEWLSN